jgi:YVTN family beta-propeller protein
VTSPAEPRSRSAFRWLAALLGVVSLAGCRPNAASAPSAFAALGAVKDTRLPGDTSRFDYQAFDPDTGRLYIAHLGASEIVVFDTKTDQVLATITNVSQVHGVIVVPQLARLYASSTGNNTVSVIDTASLQILTTVPAGDYPDGLAYDPDVGKLYVSDESGQTESVIDARTNTLVKTIALGGEAGNSQYDSTSHRILVAVQTRNQVVAIDPSTDEIVDRFDIPGCDEPHGLALDSTLEIAFVACQANAKLVVFDLRQQAVTESASVGDTPDVLAVDPQLQLLYVAAEDGVLTTFKQDQGRLTQVGKGLVGQNAHSVAVNPGSHHVYLPLRNVDGHPVLREMSPRSG